MMDPPADNGRSFGCYNPYFDYFVSGFVCVLFEIWLAPVSTREFEAERAATRQSSGRSDAMAECEFLFERSSVAVSE